jgi:hypothetical protein
VAILDMNEELATELVQEIGGEKTKFFECNVLETESISAAVKGSLDWVHETGKAVGGVIAAAGVSTPAKVCSSIFLEHCSTVFFLNKSSYLWRSKCSSTVCWHRISKKTHLACDFQTPHVPLTGASLSSYCVE